MKLLLHACCGPCSLEPVRLLQEQGHDITIAFANANIQPRDEYDRRLDVLRTWAETEHLPVVDLPYIEADWRRDVGMLEEQGAPRAQRCRACYRLRLEQAACYAAEQGYEALSTTLAVSPYQFFESCHEELQAACKRHGLACIWQDFRPYYPTGTQRSRALGMYRQNYCGCLYSKAEAHAERTARKTQQAAKAAQHEADLAKQRQARAKRQTAIHQEKQRRRALKHAALHISKPSDTPNPIAGK